MLGALVHGLRRTAAAPGLVILLWLASLVAALPAAVVVHEAIHRSVGTSLARESLRGGFDTGWFGEFEAASEGLPATLSPSHTGVGAVLDTLDAWWNGDLFRMPVSTLAFGVAFALLWLFLVGGALTRLHRPRDRMGWVDVVAAGGRLFPRYLRLAVLSAPLYYGVFRLAGWLFPKIEHLTRDVTLERTVLVYNMLAAVLIVLLLALVKMVGDYAKIAIVVENRRSSVLAFLAGCGFVLRHPISTLGLVSLFAVLTMALIAAFAAVAPGARESTVVGIILAIAASQVFLVLRTALRLGLLASQVVLFDEQRRRI